MNKTENSPKVHHFCEKSLFGLGTYEQCNLKMRKCAGLDPAGPLFKKWPKNVRLDAGDAEFVDVIHTDAGIFGFPRSVGHVDFWPNQGLAPQPGCTLAEIKYRSPDSIIEPRKAHIPSHNNDLSS